MSNVGHDLRSRCDAILVGINTVLCDDPLLTVRRAEPVRQLIRIVLDQALRIPLQSRLVMTAKEQKVIVYTTESAIAADPDHRRRSADYDDRD